MAEQDIQPYIVCSECLSSRLDGCEVCKVDNHAFKSFHAALALLSDRPRGILDFGCGSSGSVDPVVLLIQRPAQLEDHTGGTSSHDVDSSATPLTKGEIQAQEKLAEEMERLEERFQDSEKSVRELEEIFGKRLEAMQQCHREHQERVEQSAQCHPKASSSSYEGFERTCFHRQDEHYDHRE
ncbi:Uu.00g144130.m01.CDS01 [Anthostomella pinea]|uniref:Uu.00g144130.m01.CDS01 n=1 Tax=Anthostomella pinea TaxID=933095 RepID=A0AAI8VRZ3_9PEZI|nr:Uu.00g144130.m01.CDS01 [Anthostomella pinea]